MITFRREIKEETNLEMGQLELLTNLTFIRPDGIPVLCFSFFAPFISGEVKIDNDATDFAWITIGQVGNYDFIDGIDNEIREIDKILKDKRIAIISHLK